MDIAAHTLWAGAGVAVLCRTRPLPLRTVAATLVMAALPDMAHLLPIVFWWWFGQGTFADVWAYVIAVSATEPPLPPRVQLLSHHLHCVMHSALVAGAATLLIGAVRRTLWIPLLGWWSHIVIDIFTHSAAYYPAPVLYPITEEGFDGIAWNTPWALALNYFALAAVGVWLVHTRRRGQSTLCAEILDPVLPSIEVEVRTARASARTSSSV